MIGLLIVLVVLGVIFYFIDSQIPMSPPFKLAFRIIAVLICLVLLLQAFGVNLGLGGVFGDVRR